MTGPITRIRTGEGKEFFALGDPRVIVFLLRRSKEMKYDFRWCGGDGSGFRIPWEEIGSGSCSIFTGKG